jgi:hypothetical protein
MRSIKTQTGVGSSDWIPVDFEQCPFGIGFGAVVTGTPSYSIEHTFDDVFGTDTPTAFTNILGTGLTTNQDGNYAFNVSGVRVTIASGTGSVVLTLLQGRQS